LKVFSEGRQSTTAPLKESVERIESSHDASAALMSLIHDNSRGLVQSLGALLITQDASAVVIARIDGSSLDLVNTISHLETSQDASTELLPLSIGNIW
jgi:hypothetical protein